MKFDLDVSNMDLDLDVFIKFKSPEGLSLKSRVVTGFLRTGFLKNSHAHAQKLNLLHMSYS